MVDSALSMIGSVESTKKPNSTAKIFEISITHSTMIEVSLQVRPAVPQDQHQIANLMFFESHVHRHLDWHAPLEWLGSPFYWVVEENGRDVAALACPQDPEGVAWVRLFAHARQLPLDDAWTVLWSTAQKDIGQQGGATVALIAMHQWLSDLLVKEMISPIHQDIIMLEWKEQNILEMLLVDGVNSSHSCKPTICPQLPSWTQLPSCRSGKIRSMRWKKHCRKRPRQLWRKMHGGWSGTRSAPRIRLGLTSPGSRSGLMRSSGDLVR